MKKNRVIFYSVFGLLILLILIFSLYVDYNSHNGKDPNLSFLFGLLGYIWIPKYCSITLLIMFATNLVMHLRDNRESQHIINGQQREITELKAKLYDKGQGAKVPTPGV